VLARISGTFHFDIPTQVYCRCTYVSIVCLTEVFPWFFLSCKANARVILAKMGHGPHSSKLVVIVFVLSLLVLLFMGILYYFMNIFILFYVNLCYSIILYYSMYCLCVYVYKPLPPGVYPIAVDKYIISYHIIKSKLGFGCDVVCTEKFC
jgi:hypothetical protein